MKEKRIQEKGEKSETHKENGKKKCETHYHGSKSETLERKTSCLVRESEVKKVLLENKPLYLLYFKNNILIANNYNELVVLTSVEFLLQ